MSDLFPLPEELKQVEYAQLYLHLEIGSYFDLPPLGLLQLRRELRQALKSLQLTAGAQSLAQLEDLLCPSESPDPLLRKQFKKPAPGFVLTPDPARQGLCEPKDRIVLPLLLLGSAVDKFSSTIRLFEQLGQQGLCHGVGQFVLEAIETEDASGLRSMLWKTGESKVDLQPQICDLYWWLERQRMLGPVAVLEIVSPMRLISGGKPLFKADFADFFPYLLRRVTSMLACHAGVEPVEYPAGLIDLATRLESDAHRLHWSDWRRLEGESGTQDLGGLLGTIRVTGPALAEIAWLLQLGRLLNVGKGAAYGAGQYRLKSL